MKPGCSTSFLLLAAALALCGLHAARGERPGVCPGERVHVKDPFVDLYCEKDEGCHLVQKCCLDNEDRFCKPPAKERPGECPIVSFKEADIENREDFCSSDSECAGVKKCCLTKKGRTCDPSFKAKPGTCPLPNLSCFRAARLACDSDSGCEGNLKCCPSECGMQCEPPT